MQGIYAYVSYLSIYYLILVVVDLIGSVREYKKSVIAAEKPENIKFKIDFNSDLAVSSLIYLVSYYSGVFDA
tara:strand:+ start:1084 stop:1299 length:216 start_codon:yes stop_codon:yes gene_type:complete